MKIKVPPYPNNKITETAVNNVVAQSVPSNSSTNLSNKLLAMVTFDSGESRVIKSRAIRYDNKLFIASFPNPVHLFLNSAIEQYNISEEIMTNDFMKNSRQMGADVFLLTFVKDGTNNSYNKYIQNRLSSILNLSSALEAFLNHIIPNDFIYCTERKGLAKKFNKEEIESAVVSFGEKLNLVIPQWLENEKFWEQLAFEKKLITELYINRRNIVHLKTNAEDDFARYFDTFDQMLNLDIKKAIDASIKFMNTVSPDFVVNE